MAKCVLTFLYFYLNFFLSALLVSKMSEVPDYPEREPFIPYIPGFIHGSLDVPIDISFELRQTLLRFANQWTMPEDYYLLKYSIEAFKNNKICL